MIEDTSIGPIESMLNKLASPIVTRCKGFIPYVTASVSRIQRQCMFV